MENSLQIFNNEEFGQVRTVAINEDPYFMLADVCRVLEIVNPTRTKARLNEKGLHTMKVLTNGGEQQATFINESNLYKLVFTSRKKEAEAFADWVTSEVLPSIRKTGSYSIKQEVTEYQKKELEVKEKEANIQLAKLWMQLGDRTSIPEYKQITDSYASLVLAGKPVLPLPQMEKQTYSATEIGEMLGISKNKVGTLAKKYNLKTNEFGKWFYDKSPYSSKEVETFRYFDTIVPKLQEIL